MLLSLDAAVRHQEDFGARSHLWLWGSLIAFAGATYLAWRRDAVFGAKGSLLAVSLVCLGSALSFIGPPPHGRAWLLVSLTGVPTVALTIFLWRRTRPTWGDEGPLQREFPDAEIHEAQGIQFIVERPHPTLEPGGVAQIGMVLQSVWDTPKQIDILVEPDKGLMFRSTGPIRLAPLVPTRVPIDVVASGRGFGEQRAYLGVHARGLQGRRHPIRRGKAVANPIGTWTELLIKLNHLPKPKQGVLVKFHIPKPPGVVAKLVRRIKGESG